MAHRYTAKIRRALRFLAEPLREQAAFFLSFIAITGCCCWGFLMGNLDQWHLVSATLRWIGVSALVSYCPTCVVHACRGGWRVAAKWVFYALALLLMATYAFLWNNFEMGISPHTATLLAETSEGEAREFVQTYYNTQGTMIAAICVAVALIIVVALEWQRRALAGVLYRKWARRLVVLPLMVLVFTGLACSYVFVQLATARASAEMDAWERDHEPNGADLVTSAIYSLHYLRTSGNDIVLATAQARAVQEVACATTEADSLDVVFILGESYNKHHASLYGYATKTTPFLERERETGNLYVFTDVVAPYNATSVVEKNVFSCNSMADGEYWYDRPTFPAVFHRAGFNVYFWDMQRNFMPHKLYTITVNDFLYNEEIARLSYTDTVTQNFAYDGQLVADFIAHKRVPPARHNLVIFHFMGQHVSPRERYPSSFVHFTADSIHRDEPWLTKDKKGYIAHYDNATLYNDAVMGAIFDLYRQRNAVVVYFADHGDEVYDYRDVKGRHGHYDPDSLHLKHHIEVPFMIWCSDTYKARHPEMAARIEAARDRPFMLDNACQLIFHLASLQSPYYRPERDPLSPSFTPTRRIVYYRYDYDARRHPAPSSR